MAATLNFSFANNVGRRIRVNMTLNGEPWDIAGSGYVSARMELRAPADNDVAALILNTEDGTLSFDGTALVIDIPRALALGVPAGAYPFDVLLFHPTADARRPLAGVVTVEQGVTK